MRRHFVRASVAVALALLPAVSSRAEVTYDVTLDTSPLTANSSQGAFYFDFELAGDGTGNNTATISDFTVTGGSIAGGSQGSVDGSVSPAIDLSVPSTVLSLTDSASYPLVDFNQAFLPGSQLSFTLGLTTNVNTPEITTPDQFIFQVASDVGPNYDNNTNPNASFTSVLTIDIAAATVTDTASPTVSSLGGQLGLPAGGNTIFTPAATVQLEQPSPVPEPSTLMLFGGGLIGLVATRRRRCAKPTVGVRAVGQETIRHKRGRPGTPCGKETPGGYNRAQTPVVGKNSDAKFGNWNWANCLRALPLHRGGPGR